MAEEEKQPEVVSTPQGTSKAGIGFVCAFFLGLIGLLFMLCWPAGSYERKTFTKGWMITFFVMLAVEVVIVIVYVSMFMGLFAGILGSIPQA